VLEFDAAGFNAIAAAALDGGVGFNPQASLVGAGLLEAPVTDIFVAGGATTLDRSRVGTRESIRRRSCTLRFGSWSTSSPSTRYISAS
jgi:hypothetical protein